MNKRDKAIAGLDLKDAQQQLEDVQGTCQEYATALVALGEEMQKIMDRLKEAQNQLKGLGEV